jgi:NAD(P)-dependent dehydrogenase (short-subunit alcohol dehydrogenase family)
MTVVLISGANSGLGQLAALAFARSGHQVAAGSRSAERAAGLERIAADEALPLRVVRLDVTEPESVQQAVRETHERFGPIDVLVNNAGVTSTGVIEWVSEEHAHQVMETNFFGPLRLVQAVLPSMRERRRGSIVLIGSLHGRVPAPGAGIYAASKQAAAALHDALAFEAERFGIQVSSVDIGPYRTGIAARAVADPPRSEVYADLMDRLRTRGARRLAESADPAEVAEAVVEVALSHCPPLHVPVGTHAAAWLSGDDRAERFFRQLRGDLGWPAPDHDGETSTASPSQEALPADLCPDCTFYNAMPISAARRHWLPYAVGGPLTAQGAMAGTEGSGIGVSSRCAAGVRVNGVAGEFGRGRPRGGRPAARLICWTLPPTCGAHPMGKRGKTGAKPRVLRHMCSRAAAGARYGRFIPSQGAALTSRHRTR